MKTIIRETSNLTAKDRFNMKMSNSLQNASGQTLTVYKAAIGKDIDKDGKEVDTAVLITDQGVYGCISKTAIELIDALIDMFDDSDNEPIELAVSMRPSASGREYLVLEIAD